MGSTTVLLIVLAAAGAQPDAARGAAASFSWRDAVVVGGPLLTAAVGALLAGVLAMRSASLQVRRNLREQCFATFLKFHATISSVTERLAPATWKGWHEAYLGKRAALEPISDELVALTHLTISADLAARVRAERGAFDEWGASCDVAKMHPDTPAHVRDKEWNVATKEQPEKILTLLDGLTRAYAAELDGWPFGTRRRSLHSLERERRVPERG